MTYLCKDTRFSKAGFPLQDGERLEVTGRVRVEGQRTVVVEDVRREDRGMYQCLVKNFEDTAQGSAQLKLGGEFSHYYGCAGFR